MATFKFSTPSPLVVYPRVALGMPDTSQPQQALTPTSVLSVETAHPQNSPSPVQRHDAQDDAQAPGDQCHSLAPGRTSAVLVQAPEEAQELACGVPAQASGTLRGGLSPNVRRSASVDQMFPVVAWERTHSPRVRNSQEEFQFQTQPLHPPAPLQKLVQQEQQQQQQQQQQRQVEQRVDTLHCMKPTPSVSPLRARCKVKGENALSIANEDSGAERQEIPKEGLVAKEFTSPSVTSGHGSAGRSAECCSSSAMDQSLWQKGDWGQGWPTHSRQTGQRLPGLPQSPAKPHSSVEDRVSLTAKPSHCSGEETELPVPAPLPGLEELWGGVPRYNAAPGLECQALRECPTAAEQQVSVRNKAQGRSVIRSGNGASGSWHSPRASSAYPGCFPLSSSELQGEQAAHWKSPTSTASAGQIQGTPGQSWRSSRRQASQASSSTTRAVAVEAGCSSSSHQQTVGLLGVEDGTPEPLSAMALPGRPLPGPLSPIGVTASAHADKECRWPKARLHAGSGCASQSPRSFMEGSSGSGLLATVNIDSSQAQTALASSFVNDHVLGQQSLRRQDPAKPKHTSSLPQRPPPPLKPLVVIDVDCGVDFDQALDVDGHVDVKHGTDFDSGVVHVDLGFDAPDVFWKGKDSAVKLLPVVPCSCPKWSPNAADLQPSAKSQALMPETTPGPLKNAGADALLVASGQAKRCSPRAGQTPTEATTPRGHQVLPGNADKVPAAVAAGWKTELGSGRMKGKAQRCYDSKSGIVHSGPGAALGRARTVNVSNPLKPDARKENTDNRGRLSAKEDKKSASARYSRAVHGSQATEGLQAEAEPGLDRSRSDNTGNGFVSLWKRRPSKEEVVLVGRSPKGPGEASMSRSRGSGGKLLAEELVEWSRAGVGEAGRAAAAAAEGANGQQPVRSKGSQSSSRAESHLLHETERRQGQPRPVSRPFDERCSPDGREPASSMMARRAEQQDRATRRVQVGRGAGAQPGHGRQESITRRSSWALPPDSPRGVRQKQAPEELAQQEGWLMQRYLNRSQTEPKADLELGEFKNIAPQVDPEEAMKLARTLNWVLTQSIPELKRPGTPGLELLRGDGEAQVVALTYNGRGTGLRPGTPGLALKHSRSARVHKIEEEGIGRRSIPRSQTTLDMPRAVFCRKNSEDSKALQQRRIGKSDDVYGHKQHSRDGSSLQILVLREKGAQSGKQTLCSGSSFLGEDLKSKAGRLDLVCEGDGLPAELQERVQSIPEFSNLDFSEEESDGEGCFLGSIPPRRGHLTELDKESVGVKRDNARVSRGWDGLVKVVEETRRAFESMLDGDSSDGMVLDAEPVTEDDFLAPC